MVERPRGAHERRMHTPFGRLLMGNLYEAGLNQRKLAEALGMPPSQLSCYFFGDHEITEAFIDSVSRVAGFSDEKRTTLKNAAQLDPSEGTIVEDLSPAELVALARQRQEEAVFLLQLAEKKMRRLQGS